MDPGDDDTDLRLERTVEAPIDRAFSVFTERCHQWWPPMYRLGEGQRVDVRIEPGVGGRWYEVSADGQECDWGRVLAWEPPHHVALSWQITPRFTPEADPERASRCDVRFVAEGPARTRVALVHSDFSRHGEGWQSMRAGVDGEGGWPGILDAYSAVAARPYETSPLRVEPHGGNWVVRDSPLDPPVGTFPTREEAERRAREWAGSQGRGVEVREDPRWEPEEAAQADEP